MDALSMKLSGPDHERKSLYQQCRARSYTNSGLTTMNIVGKTVDWCLVLTPLTELMQEFRCVCYIAYE